MNFRIFIGEAQTAIDEKGRTAFPRDFRRQLSDGERENLVVTKGPEGSLRLFVFSEFEKFMAELDSMRDRRLAELVRGNLSMQLVNL
ncbi:MAG: MraZ N-terminal domain-containing protein, partial [Fibrobacteraceae bacterium]|nr:MraZ N-terminal domain-containing protein [Fibrobacteraceae bacterium]